ncbi:MAG: hypothetical protein FJ104_02555 [Deltaproteobacteria bacterium]|nr:hypothetical protein [Deltaproteobacteria bacterium]
MGAAERSAADGAAGGADRRPDRARIRVVDSISWLGRFLSAVAAATYNFRFFRGKDIVDLERLVAVRPELDRAYVRRWIVEMMGEDDDRTRRWDDIVARFGPG